MDTRIKKLIKMNTHKALLILFLFSVQSFNLVAWEIHPTEKVYSIYRDGSETGNSVNMIARVSVSSRSGNMDAGSLVVDVFPNYAYGNIIRSIDIISIIPNIAALVAREYPERIFDEFNLDIRYVQDIWGEYREFVQRNLTDAPGKIANKSVWFFRTSLIFLRSNQKIAAIQNSVEENFITLNNSIVMIPNEIIFSHESIGLGWNTVSNSQGLYIITPSMVTFMPKPIQSKDTETED
jgi:hypothetical protein